MNEDKAAAINNVVAKLDGMDRSVIARKEIKELPDILWEDELPERIVAGTYNNGWGILCATNQRLLFIDKGLLFGLKVESYVYEAISSVESKSGLLWGSVKVYASGNNEDFEHVNNRQAHAFAQYVREKISKSRTPTAPPIQQGASSVSVAEELTRLADLMERGILTKEEFDQQKAKLLA